MKNSDSDYKAEDEGSASDVGTKKKNIHKKPFSLKMTKKEIIEKAVKNFIPEGVTLEEGDGINEQEYKQLSEIKSANQFSLNFKVFLGKIVHITDGDTVKAVIKLGGKLTRFTFRLSGLDTPEVKKGQVKQFGKYIKDIVREMLFDKIVRIQAGKFDKYGRVLARIYAYSNDDEFSINDFLIENDMAKAYAGKTKTEFTKNDWEDFKQKYDEKTWPIIDNYPREAYNKKKAGLH